MWLRSTLEISLQVGTILLLNIAQEASGEFARRLSRTASPNSVAMIKEMFSKSSALDSAKGYAYAAKMNALARTTADFKKGIAAFLAKKKPEW